MQRLFHTVMEYVNVPIFHNPTFQIVRYVLYMEDINQRIARRITARRVQLGWTKTKVAQLAGISQGFYSKLEGGKSGFNADTAMRVAGALGLSLDRLYEGGGSVEEEAFDFRAVPLLSYEQAASWADKADQRQKQSQSQSQSQQKIPMHMDASPSTFALRLLDTSMLPRFTAGDVVIIDPTLQPKPEYFVFAKSLNGEGVFRQYRERGVNDKGDQVFELVPLNLAYPSYRSDRTPMSIVGSMIEHRIYRVT